MEREREQGKNASNPLQPVWKKTLSEKSWLISDYLDWVRVCQRPKYISRGCRTKFTPLGNFSIKLATLLIYRELLIFSKNHSVHSKYSCSSLHFAVCMPTTLQTILLIWSIILSIQCIQKWLRTKKPTPQHTVRVDWLICGMIDIIPYLSTVQLNM